MQMVFVFFPQLQEMCGTIDFREYLLCALYLIKQSLPTMELIQIVSKMYDNCGKGPGRFTRTALYNLLKHMTGATIDECVEFFTEMDTERNGFVTLGNKCSIESISTQSKNQFAIVIIDCDIIFKFIADNLRDFFRSKTEFAHLFEIPSTAKKTTRTTATKPKSQ